MEQGQGKRRQSARYDSNYRKQLQETLDAFIVCNSITGAANHLGIRRSAAQSRFDAAIQENLQPSPAALKQAGLKAPIPCKVFKIIRKLCKYVGEYLFGSIIPHILDR